MKDEWLCFILLLVPKLRFGNALVRNSVSARRGRETEFPKTDVPKPEFGNERQRNAA
jgi:hypothetical protein